MMVEEFNLNSALEAISARYTPERREEDARRNAEMRQKLGARIHPNSPEQKILRAITHESSLLEQIALLTQEPDSEIKQNRLYNALNRLSEVLYEQGKIAEAIEVCPETKRREFYQSELAKHSAVE